MAQLKAKIQQLEFDRQLNLFPHNNHSEYVMSLQDQVRDLVIERDNLQVKLYASKYNDNLIYH